MIWVIGGFLAATLAAGVVWRLASAHWNLPCPSWLAWGLDSRWAAWVYQTEKTLDRIGLGPGDRVLEIGAGPGRLLVPAARRVLPDGQAVGLDIQPAMIERLQQRARRSQLSNLTAVVGDAAISLPAGPFDVIFIALALGEIPDRLGTLRQCLSALRPTGGLLSITEMFPDPHFLTRSAVLRLAERAGFRHTSTVGSALFFTANFRPGVGLAAPDQREDTSSGDVL